FLVDDPELFELPVEKAKKPVVNLTTLLEEPSVNESIFILNSIFDEIKPEDLINLEKLFGSLIITDKPTNNDNGERSFSLSTQKEKDLIEIP
ncbi:9487_t:CDS:1, partial [Ambispora gerdemannii]